MYLSPNFLEAPAVSPPPRRFALAGEDKGAVARLAGRIYRAGRQGERVVAEVACADQAARLRLACDRIGIRPDPELAIVAASWADAACETVRPLRIALAGYGVVGQALATRLNAEPGFEIVAILVRDTKRRRAVAPPCPLGSDRAAFLATEADILIDVLSCEIAGADLTAAALAHGRSVASASKRVIAAHGSALSAAATQSGASLLYSAAVGGAAPVLETVAAARAHGGVIAVDAVLNGTVNYILDRLHKGFGFDEALALARAAGFAEEDPSSDLTGGDAAAKLKLIAGAAFGVDPASVAVETETLDATRAEAIRASRRRWVQLARLTREGASVSLIPADDAEGLPALPDEWNCALVTCADGAALRCVGRGAGGAATAEAIVADLFQIRDSEA